MFKKLTVVLPFLFLTTITHAEPSTIKPTNELKEHMAALLAEPSGITFIVSVLNSLKAPEQGALASLAICQAFNKENTDELKACIIKNVIDHK